MGKNRDRGVEQGAAWEMMNEEQGGGAQEQ